MEHDFHQLIQRKGTDCVKWDGMKPVFGRDDLLPLWVADMDFPAPKPVVDAVVRRAMHPVYGYAMPSDSFYEAVIDKVRRQYHWEIQREWIVVIEGIVGGIASGVKSMTLPGDNIIIQTPVYTPFYNSIEDAGCHVKKNPLLWESGRYEIDFEGLKASVDNRTQGMILCSPHNPVGRVWTPKELNQLGEIVLEKDLLVLADEIHCDLVYQPHHHTVFATLDPSIADRTITFFSASKTFNIAGLATSVAIIPNQKLRNQFVASRGRVGTGNLFGTVALEAAYREGDPYLEQLLGTLKGNIDYFIEAIRTQMPKLRVVEPEGTYLVWVDFNGLGLNADGLNQFLIETCGLAVNDGRIFGKEGDGYFRFNLGCPRTLVERAIQQLVQGYQGLERAYTL